MHIMMHLHGQFFSLLVVFYREAINLYNVKLGKTLPCIGVSLKDRDSYF